MKRFNWRKFKREWSWKKLSPCRYVSYYSLYSIYEPAEGGYCYNGCELLQSESVLWLAAPWRLRAYARYFNCPSWYNKSKSVSYSYNYGYSIGEGQFVAIELKRGSYASGRKPYE